MNSQNLTPTEAAIDSQKAAGDQGPHRLARTVFRALCVSTPEPPEEALLETFFDAAYQVSFRGGRGRILWLGWEKLSAEPGHLALTPPVLLEGGSLALLLEAAAGQAALLVSGSGTHIVVRGLAQRERSVPGLFRVDILGPAHLKVDAGLDWPIELRRNRLHLSASQALKRGLVRERLSALLHGLFPALLAQLPAEAAASPLLSAGAVPLPGSHALRREQDWPEALEEFWISALADLLRRLLEIPSGGLVMLTSCGCEIRREEDAPKETEEEENEQKEGEEWLLPPQGAVFTQARQLLERRAVRAVLRQTEAVRVMAERLAARQEIAPDEPALQEPALWLGTPSDDLETAAALQFLASLSQANGIVRLSPNLDLLSFGGEPAGRLPSRVYLAGDEAASSAHLTPISSRSFGPRNQALLRLCQQDPSAVGFAATQDKELRVMLRCGDKLIVWNSVMLPRID